MFCCCTGRWPCKLHWFSTGHEDLSLQLQLFSSMFSSSLRNIFVLCALTMLSMFGMHEYESLTVLSLNRRCRGCCLGKCKRSSLKNSLPILVATFLLYGGLYQMIRLLRFLFGLFVLLMFGSNVKVSVYPASSKAF